MTVFFEKFGSKIDGVIAGIPATMLVALFFIALTQSKEFASQSVTAIPLMLGLNIVVVISYVIFARIIFYLGFVFSIFVWFMMSLVLYLIKFDNFQFSIILYLLILFIFYFILEYLLDIKSLKSKKINYTNYEIFLRVFIAGLVILLLVLFSKLGGPLLGGISASFPILTVVLIILTYKNHGIKFTEALLKNFILTGTINVFIFVLVIKYFYLNLNLYLGTFLGIISSIFINYKLYFLVNKRLK